MAFRFNLVMSDDLPAGSLVLYKRGAIVSGTQDETNVVTVHEGHDFEVGEKFLYALTRTNISTDRVFTITAKDATSVTFESATRAFPDGAHLVPLGVDTGGVLQSDGTYSALQWDGSTATIYSDPAGDDALDDAITSVDPGGEVGFWADLTDLWGVSRNTAGKPLRAYILSAATGGATTGTETDAIWTAKGDIAVGTAPATAAPLTVGTDGQVLTADSGETTGVKWATPGTGDVATDAIWDTKGDVAVASASNTADNLPVGSDGQVLTADSGETLGVKWATPSSGGVTEDDSELHIAVSVFH